MALCAVFGLPSAVTPHATGDIAYELESVNVDRLNLFYVYLALVVKVDAFTAHASHVAELPYDIPRVPIPADLSPHGEDNYILMRGLTRL
jgi:hypothetical protein